MRVPVVLVLIWSSTNVCDSSHLLTQNMSEFASLIMLTLRSSPKSKLTASHLLCRRCFQEIEVGIGVVSFEFANHNYRAIRLQPSSIELSLNCICLYELHPICDVKRSTARISIPTACAAVRAGGRDAGLAPRWQFVDSSRCS